MTIPELVDPGKFMMAKVLEGEQDTCPACSAQVRYSITTDSHICCGCGKTYAWPMRPQDEPTEAAPLDEPPAEPNPEQEPQ
jgi:hypothetical protein